jgi:nucleotide-binding universal stress UspA family protein
MRRILIAYDGTEPSEVALERGIELGRALGASVGIVSVAPPEPGVRPDDPWSELSEHAAVLYEARRRADAAGLIAETHEPVGNPGPMIVKVAADFEYDTIVVGARQMSRLRRTLLGSVSRYVARHSPATIVVAR